MSATATVETPLKLSDLSDNTYQGLPEEIRKEKRKDIYEIDPRRLEVSHEDNMRTEYGDLEPLKQIIRENGVPGLLEGIRINKDGEIYFQVKKDGFRRTKAIQELLEEGTDPGMVPFRVLPKDYSEEQRTLDMLLSNGGKPFTSLEEGHVFIRLEEEFGYSRKKIGSKFGKSEPHVCNMIQLAKSGGVLVDEVQAGHLSTTSAVKLMKAVPEEADRKAVIERGVEIAGARGKTKATTDDLAKAANELLNPELLSLPAADEDLLERDELPQDPTTAGMPQLFDGVDDQPHKKATVPSAPDPAAADKKSLISAGAKIANTDKTMKKLLELQDEIPAVGKPNISQQTVKKIIAFLNEQISFEDLVEFVNE
jgi:ParB-like chromosome segregation protein Spo0J